MNRLESFVPSARAAYALLVAGSVIWGSGMVIGRGVHEAIPPVGLGFWRAVVAILVLAPFVALDLPRLRHVVRAHWRFIIVLGLLQIWPQAIVLIALNFTTAINATLINGAQPAIVAIVLGVLYRERISAGQALGIVLALCGIAVMVSRGEWTAIAELRFNIGDWLTLGAVIMFASYSILIPRVPGELGLMTTLFLISLSGAATMLPFYVVESIFVRSMDFNAITVGTVAWMGVVISAVSILLWNMSLRAIGSQRAAIFLNLNPVFAALFAVVFLGEDIFVYHLAGAALVCGGITLVVSMARRPAAITQPLKAEA